MPSSSTSVGTIQFNSPGSNYVFNLSGNTLDLTSASGGIVDNSAATITFANGPITGVGGVQQNGTGTLILSGTDTYSGATTVSAGTLQVNGSQVNGSIVSPVTVNTGGTLDGTGTVGTTSVGRGVLEPGNAANPTGTLTVNGNLTLSSVADYIITVTGSSAGAINVIGNATLSGGITFVAAPGTANNYSPADSFTIVKTTGDVSRTFSSIAVAGSFGNLVPYLNYNNTLNNNTNTSITNNSVVMGLTPGTVWLGATATGGAYDWSSTTNWAGGIVPTSVGVANEPATTVATFGGQTNNTVTINSIASAVALLFTSGVTAPYNFGINGGGTLILAGAGIDDNSSNPPQFTVGGATLGGGTLSFRLASTAGDAIITNNSGGATVFGISGGLDTATAGTANITNNSGGTTTFNAQTTAGSATITTNNGGTTDFAGNSTAGNAILITNSGGVVEFTGTGIVIPNNAGTNSNSVGAGAIEGPAGGQIELNTNTLTVNAGIAGSSFAGVISGSGGLTIAGGTTTLTGTNTYTGATTINGGTLAVNGSGGSIASSSGVAVNSGGTLSGTGTVPGVTVAAGGTLSPGASGAGTLTINGNLSLLSGADYQVGISTTSGTNSSATASGTASLAGILTAVAAPGTYTTSDTYTVLNAAKGLSGSFSGLTVSGSFGDLVPYLTHTSQSEILNLTAGNTWTGGTSNWNNSSNWSLGTVPSASSLNPNDAVATFKGAGGTITVDTAASAGTLLFTSTGTSPFTLNINNGKSLILNGLGIDDNSTHAPTFTVGGAGTGSQLTFENAATAGDAAINVGSGGAAIFLGNSTGGTAQFTTSGNGIVDFSDTAGPGSNGNVTAGSIAGSGAVYLGSNTLTVGNSSNQTFSGVISSCGTSGTSCEASLLNGGVTVSGGSLVKVGSATLTLTGTNTYTGTTTIDAGTLALGAGGSIATSSAVAIATGATFDISGSGGASIMSLANSAPGQAGTVALGSNTLKITNGSTIFSGVISGSGGNLTVTGGVQELAGVNTYTGATTIDAGGTLVLGTTNAIADTSSVTINGGTLGLGGYSQKLPTTVTLLNGGTIEGGLLGATTISSTGGSVIGIGGSAAVTAASGTTTLGGVNTYFGTTTINSGATLVGGAANAFSPNSAVTDNGTLDLGSNNQTILSLSGSGTVTNASNPLNLSGSNTPVLTIGASTGLSTTFPNGITYGTLTSAIAGSTPFSGVITNGSASGVTNTTGLMVARGILTLSGNMSANTNAYTGATTVAGGVLNVTGNISQSSAVNVTAGGNIEGVPIPGVLTGTGTVPGVAVLPGGVLAPGPTGGGTLTIDGNLVLDSDYAATLYTNGTNSAAIVAAGNVALLNGVFTAIAGGGGGTYSAATTYTVLSTLTANNVSGSFIGIDMAGSFGNLVPYYTVNASNVTVGLTAGTPWVGGVSSNNWNAAGNWTGSVIPTASASAAANTVATFGNTAQTTVNITSAASAGALLFTSAVTSPYTFNINSGGALVLGGIGIDDNSSHPPTFNVGSSGSGTLGFANAATAGDATINVASGGVVAFGGASNGGTAVFNNSGGTVDFSGTLGPFGSGV
ncbi:MAG TPA: autotransporter-associated beta strand repeat-containing protein, partial [Xanthobacteraceae bacterium]|nr:autotransporter-associated beta strand repeat-containing protein [Xanthobacteraceae bacterium]